jgi:ankyrin repeat protein
MLRVAWLLVLSLAVTLQQDPGERFYQSIRNNDLVTLRSLIRDYGVDTKDSRGQTPLMLAAAFGSFDATKLLVDSGADAKAVSASRLTALHLSAGDLRKVRLLVDHGADVNARSQMGRSPLLVAAYTTGAYDVVQFLLSKGADPNAADASRITPLIAALSVNDSRSAKLLLDKGSEIDVTANIAQAATPLMAAAHNGNADLTRLLLSKGSSVNVASTAGSATVLNGQVQFGAATALHFAALSGNSEVVKLLLGAGARVDAPDMRGMTPLMWAVSTDRPNVSIVRELVKNGSDPSFRSKTGESPIDWAQKFNNPTVMTELNLRATVVPASSSVQKPVSVTPRDAVAQSMPLLQKTSSAMLSKGGCNACHAQPVTHMAIALARDRGWSVGESFPMESLQVLRTRWFASDQGLLQGLEAGGTPDTTLYNAMALAAVGEPASWNSDVFVAYLISKQRPEGRWRGIGASRAPIQDGDFSRTAMAVRTLASFGIPARKSEIDERIRRAADWLAAQTPISTEDRVMQLLGLKWSGANSRGLETRTRELVAQQRSDGGWAQTQNLASDAYATGQVLYTLRELGAATDAGFRRGVEYLLRTQKEDGSWYVKSRAMKIQPYFESGFPYEHDQWISTAATAWATMALSRSEDVPVSAAVAPTR